jgi:replication factor A1
LKRWSNARGEGTLFSVDLLDSYNGEIRATFFKEACDKFFPLIEEGKVYSFSNGQAKNVQNKQYSNLKNNYELTFGVTADIRAVADDAQIKSQTYNFLKIDRIGFAEPNQTIDVIGVVKLSSELSEIVSQKLGGKQLTKRDLMIIDESGCEIKLTLWGDKATGPFPWETRPIAAFKCVKIGDYGGRSLSSMTSTSVIINPPIPEGFALNSFRQQFPDGNIPVGSSLSSGGTGGGGGQVDTLEKRKNIADIKEQGLGLGEKPDYISVKGTVVYIKHDNDPWYTACITPNCNKKVTESMHGQWLCEKCNKQFDSCQRRYILTISMSDHSGSYWFSLFNETVITFLHKILYQLY